jgi:hypothetical protein
VQTHWRDDHDTLRCRWCSSDVDSAAPAMNGWSGSARRSTLPQHDDHDQHRALTLAADLGFGITPPAPS